MTSLADEAAINNYSKFREREGSEHIATLASQKNLAELLFRYNPKVVLDWGSGIGTLTCLAHSINSPKIWAYEESEYCLKLAESNLAGVELRYIEAKSIPRDLEAVFIDAVIDDFSLNQILECPGIRFIFIEGWRNSTVVRISRRLRKFGFRAKFARGNGWLDNIINSENYEKDGSWFELRKASRFASLLSRLARIWRTGELGEYFFGSYFKLASATYKFRHPTKK